MKITITIILLLSLLLTGCIKLEGSSYYLRPTKFDKDESKLIKLIEINEKILFYDFKVMDSINVIDLSVETYKNNILINKDSFQNEIDKKNGSLIIKINDDDNFKVDIKYYSKGMTGIGEYHADKIKEVKNASHWTVKYRESEFNLDDNNEVVIAVYQYDIGNGIRSFSIEGFQKNEYEYENINVIFKIKFLESFE